MNLKQ